MNDKNIFLNKILAPIESITFSPPVEYLTEGNSPTENVGAKLPSEVVIQSSPIQTEVQQVSSYSTETVPPTQSYLENETDSTPSTSTDTRISDQQQLIDFIQKLMGQAKKEQEKRKNRTPPPVELQLDIKKVDLSNFSPISINKFPQMDLEDFVSPVTEGLGVTENDGVTPRQSQSSTSTSTTSTTTSLATTTQRARETAPVLPFRTTLRTTSTSTTTTTTEDGTPGGVITKLLSEAAAPIAGLSAATLAYSAAAMLPVWLPAALGRRKRSTQIELELLSNPDLYENTNLSA